jgi:hypothetical protein
LLKSERVQVLICSRTVLETSEFSMGIDFLLHDLVVDAAGISFEMLVLFENRAYYEQEHPWSKLK